MRTPEAGDHGVSIARLLHHHLQNRIISSHQPTINNDLKRKATYKFILPSSRLLFLILLLRWWMTNIRAGKLVWMKRDRIEEQPVGWWVARGAWSYAGGADEAGSERRSCWDLRLPLSCQIVTLACSPSHDHTQSSFEADILNLTLKRAAL
jgi:hypothetical protein